MITFYWIFLSMIIFIAFGIGVFVSTIMDNREENKLLTKFANAAKKQKHALGEGGFGHAIWCNFQQPNGNGKGRCNCGVSDLQTALKEYEKD